MGKILFCLVTKKVYGGLHALIEHPECHTKKDYLCHTKRGFECVILNGTVCIIKGNLCHDERDFAKIILVSVNPQQGLQATQGISTAFCIP